MVNFDGKELEEYYGQLVNLMQHQVDLLEHINVEQDEQVLQQFLTLSDKWKSISTKIDVSMEKSNGELQENKDTALFIRQSIERMIVLGLRIESLLNNIKAQDSSTMLNIKKQQTTLRSYGGVGSGEAVPLYFDERQ